MTAAVVPAGNTQQFSKQVSPSTPTDSIVFHEVFDPPGDDSPDRTSGVGSRGGRCNLQEQPIQALMPSNNFGLTFAERPTVVLQLPENTSAQRLILTVTDERGLYYAEEDFSLPLQAGLISLSLSDQSLPLTTGRNYRWNVVVVCGEQADPDNPVLMGWIQRVDTALSQPLLSKDPLGQVRWLAENGYWYDMLEVLMGELQSDPQNTTLQATWQSIITPQERE